MVTISFGVGRTSLAVFQNSADVAGASGSAAMVRPSLRDGRSIGARVPGVGNAGLFSGVPTGLGFILLYLTQTSPSASTFARELPAALYECEAG